MAVRKPPTSWWFANHQAVAPTHGAEIIFQFGSRGQLFEVPGTRLTKRENPRVQALFGEKTNKIYNGFPPLARIVPWGSEGPGPVGPLGPGPKGSPGPRVPLWGPGPRVPLGPGPSWPLGARAQGALGAHRLNHFALTALNISHQIFRLKHFASNLSP